MKLARTVPAGPSQMRAVACQLEMKHGVSHILAAGLIRPSVHKSTLKELAAASPSKHPASLEQQLAELQHDLKAKQAEVDAGRADLEHRQRLLQFAAGLLPCSRVLCFPNILMINSLGPLLMSSFRAGAARREVLELRAYKDKADAALALAEKRIEELKEEVNTVTSKLTGSTLAHGKVSEVDSFFTVHHCHLHCSASPLALWHVSKDILVSCVTNERMTVEPILQACQHLWLAEQQKNVHSQPSHKMLNVHRYEICLTRSMT